MPAYGYIDHNDHRKCFESKILGFFLYSLMVIISFIPLTFLIISDTYLFSASFTLLFALGYLLFGWLIIGWILCFSLLYIPSFRRFVEKVSKYEAPAWIVDDPSL